MYGVHESFSFDDVLEEYGIKDSAESFAMAMSESQCVTNHAGISPTLFQACVKEIPAS